MRRQLLTGDLGCVPFPPVLSQDSARIVPSSQSACPPKPCLLSPPHRCQFLSCEWLTPPCSPVVVVTVLCSRGSAERLAHPPRQKFLQGSPSLSRLCGFVSGVGFDSSWCLVNNLPRLRTDNTWTFLCTCFFFFFNMYGITFTPCSNPLRQVLLLSAF